MVLEHKEESLERYSDKWSSTVDDFFRQFHAKIDSTEVGFVIRNNMNQVERSYMDIAHPVVGFKARPFKISVQIQNEQLSSRTNSIFWPHIRVGVALISMRRH